MVDRSLQEQIDDLVKILLKNSNIDQILNGSPFPDGTNWYLGAGCVCQTVWNYLSGKKLTEGINDYDLIYYDPTDTSYEAEDVYIQKGKELFKNLPVIVEIRNQARVHLWLENKSGKKIDQLKSCEDAVNGWPTTATAIGVNKINGKINVYAPYGLNDLFGMVVRPNKPSTIKWVYEKKVEKWTKKWPNLKIIQ